MFFHGPNTEGLLKYIDSKCVPTKYGGTCTTSLNNGQALWKLVCQYDNEFRSKWFVIACIIIFRAFNRDLRTLFCLFENKLKTKESQISPSKQ